MMNRCCLSRNLCVLLSSVLVLASCSTALAQKGKKPPKNDPPPPLPAVRYSIVVPNIPEAATFSSWGTRDLSNFGMLVGYYQSETEGAQAFLFDIQTEQLYEPHLVPELITQLHALAPGYRFRRLIAINDLGVAVGSIYNPVTGDWRGVAIDTGLSSQVSTWDVYLLPDLGNVFGHEATDINSWGDILAYYETEQGTRHHYVYNPFADPVVPAVDVGLSSTSLASPASINDLGEVLQHNYTVGPIEVHDANQDRINSFDLGRISDSVSFNNAGYISAIWKNQTIGGKGKRQDILVRINARTGDIENVLTSGPYSIYLDGNEHLNANSDVAVSVGSDTVLIHRGFSNDSTLRFLNMDDLIADDDPWRDDWIASDASLGGHSISALADRSDQDDATGYPVMAGVFRSKDGTVKAAVLVPIDAP